MSNPLNTSATGGTLPSIPPLPLDDGALDDVFQRLTVDVTGLPGEYVRPRWQQAVPKQPEPGVNWCAIGIMSMTPDNGPWLVYDPVNNVEYYWDHEVLDVLASFYGPNAQSFARLLRNGLEIPQNTEELLPYAIRYIGCGVVRVASELVNQQWVRRYDLMLEFRRKVVETYGVQNIAIADINLLDDTGQVNDTIVVPPGSPIQP